MVGRSYYLSTFAIGLGLLIWGRYYFNAPDWDIPISIIMATLAYLTAPYSMRAILNKRWRDFPLMFVFTWLTVDGSYWLYWSLTDQAALFMRPANFWASLSLYWMCGLVWYNRRGII